MFCKNCGNKLPDNAKFCDVCGNALSLPQGSSPAAPAQAIPGVEVQRQPAQCGQQPQYRQPAPPPQPAPKRPGRRTSPVIAAISVVIALVCLCVFVIVPGISQLTRGSGPSSFVLHDVGEYAIKEPDTARLVPTEDWGPLPANQIGVVLSDGLGPADAERIAGELGARVVGEIEFFNMYQLENDGATEEDLRALLAAAAAAPGVKIAAPNIPVCSRTVVEGRDCTPLDDPMYSEGDNGRAYDMIGLQDAWDIIRASGVELNPTRVGVIDDVIYSESGHEFSTELHLPDADGTYPAGKVRTIPIDRNRDLSAVAHADPSGDLNMGGLGHGTGVAHVIAAEPGGGAAGVAGILGENLEMLVSVHGEGKTLVPTPPPAPSGVPTAPPDPGATSAPVPPPNPTVWKGYSHGMLERMLEQVQNGATVINLSWGPQFLGPKNAGDSAMMRNFLQIMHQRYPNVVFVGAAGNTGQAITGNNDFWGKNLPNLITVGALNHDGERAGPEDWNSREELETWYQYYLAKGTLPANTTYEQYVGLLLDGSNYATTGGEVTLSACGTGVPLGLTPDGETVTEHGTSFAAPQVVGAIALIRSINPELNAEQIKQILVETAAREVKRGDETHAVPENMGAGVLRVDEAVLRVINDMRAGDPEDPDYPKLPPLDRDALLGTSRVKLIAQLQPGGSERDGYEWVVTASISDAGPGGTSLQLKPNGQGTVSGSTAQKVNAPGQASWRILTADKHYSLHVSRADTGGCATLELALSDEISGVYTVSGSYSTKLDSSNFTDFQVRVEQNGSSMKVLFLDNSGWVLTGTYDESTKTFTGIDTQPVDTSSLESAFATSTIWKTAPSIITFDTDASPIRATWTLHGAATYKEGAIDMWGETNVNLTMVKVAGP